MKNGPALVLRGTILGSLVLAILGWLLAGHIKLSPATEVALAAAPSPTEEQPAEQPTQITEETDRCQVSLSYPEAILRWCALITAQATQVGLPPNLIAAVMLQESGGEESAYSSSGAVGLMQVMPRDGLAAEFACVNGPCFASRPTIEELLNPDFNVAYGSQMLAGLINRLGDVREALKSYGPMDMGYHYADIVLAIYENYR